MSGHTKGPWAIWAGQVCNEAGDCIVTEVDILSDADARLIAAAPDLLEALRKALALSDKHVSDHGRTTECQAVYDMCAAAIAKAEGRS